MNIKNHYWLADIYSSSNVYYVNNSGTLSNSGLSNAYALRPVVEICSITIIDGNGTLSSPYIGNTSKAENVSNVSVGEYINIPKSDGSIYLARVIKHDQNGTKVILNGLYTTSAFGSNTTFSTSSTIYTGALTNFKNSLDSNYFDSTNHEFNMTAYGDGANYANATTKFTGNIGLPSAGELFSGNDIDMSTSSTKTFVDSTKILNPTKNEYYFLMNSFSDFSCYTFLS